MYVHQITFEVTCKCGNDMTAVYMHTNAGDKNVADEFTCARCGAGFVMAFADKAISMCQRADQVRRALDRAYGRSRSAFRTAWERTRSAYPFLRQLVSVARRYIASLAERSNDRPTRAR
jgi:ribosomal protein S27AE